MAFLKGFILGDGDESLEDPPLIKSLKELGEKVEELIPVIEQFVSTTWETVLKPMLEWTIEKGLPWILDQVKQLLTDLTELAETGDFGDFVKNMNSLEKALAAIAGIKIASGAFKGLIELKKLKWLFGGGGAGAAGAGGGGAAAAGIATAAGVGGLAALGVGLAMVIAQFGSIPLEAYEAERATKFFAEALAETDGSAESMAEKMNELAEMASHYNDFLYDTTGYTMEYGYTMQDSADSAFAYAEMLAKLAEQLGITNEELIAQIDAAGGDVTKIDALTKSIGDSAEAMDKNRKSISDLNEEYDKSTKEISEKAGEMAQEVDAATTELKNKTDENTAAANEAATTNAESTKTNVSGEFTELEGEVATSGSNILTTTDSTFSQVAANATTWGADMVGNFIAGINSMMPALEAQLIAISNMIASYIHFTKPDKGPLADFDEYGPDMMEEFASGIEKGKGKLESAINDIAETVSFQMPAVAGGAVVPYSVSSGGGASSTSGGASSSGEMLDRLLEAIESLENSLNNMQWVAQFGNVRAVVQEITKVQRQIARSEGGG